MKSIFRKYGFNVTLKYNSRESRFYTERNKREENK